MDRTVRAEKAIVESDVVVGYARYVDSISDLTDGKQIVRSGMRQEVERVREALRLADAGRSVALISSGDPGIYGMAGLALELKQEMRLDVPIEIIPGVTAASAAAAVLGAPLMTDFAVISLSDLLVPRAQIVARIESAARAGFVTVLYNPRSKTRTDLFGEVLSIFHQSRGDDVMVGIVKNVSHDDQSVVVVRLADVDEGMVDMRTIVVIGNDQTIDVGGLMVAMRGYGVGL